MSFSSSLLYTFSSSGGPLGYLSYDAQSSPYDNLTFTSDRSSALQLSIKTAPKDYEYNICLASGGLCVDVFRENTTQPRLAPAGYYAGQQWTISEVSGDVYELENEYSGSGYALSWDDAGHVFMESGGGGNGQWKVEAVNKGGNVAGAGSTTTTTTSSSQRISNPTPTPHSSSSSSSSSTPTTTPSKNESSSSTTTPGAAVITVTADTSSPTDTDNSPLITSAISGVSVITVTPTPSQSSSSISSSDSSSDSSSSSSQSLSQKHNGGLSYGAKTGIGVGVGLTTALLLAILAFFLLRRRRRRGHPEFALSTPRSAQDPAPGIEEPYAPTGYRGVSAHYEKPPIGTGVAKKNWDPKVDEKDPAPTNRREVHEMGHGNPGATNRAELDTTVRPGHLSELSADYDDNRRMAELPGNY